MKTTINKMILFCVSLVISLILSSHIGAQSTRSLKIAQDRASFWTNEMKERLSLNDEQVKAVEAINLKYAKRMEKIELSDDSKEVKVANTVDLQREKDLEIKTVLTDVQSAKYDAIKKAIKAQLQEYMKYKK